MIKLIDLIEKNIGKRYTSMNDFLNDLKEKKIDAKELAKTFYQYLNIELSLDNYFNQEDIIDSFKIKEVIEDGD